MIFKEDFLNAVKKIEDNTFDLIIADPPYNIKKDFGDCKDNLPLEDYINWSMHWINECYRVLNKNGTMYIYGLPEIIQHIGVRLPYPQKWLFWHYTNKTVPSLNFWQKSVEVIISTWKEKPIFNKDEVREKYSASFLKNSAGKKRTTTKGRFSNGEKETIYNANEKGALPRDVLNFPALAGGAGLKERLIFCKEHNIIDKKSNHEHCSIIEHPTQKPIELTKKLILSSIDLNKTNKILIPFCGSGTEVIASLLLKQVPLSFELNEDYITLTEKKVEFYGLQR